MLGSGGSERVAELMRETAAAELLPRFRNLAKDEVRQKRPGDIVTVADVASEQRLANGLAKILPGVPVVGEEAVEKDPGLLDLVARPGEACWIVDPLDGTANFAAGRDRFAMIICLVQDATAVAQVNEQQSAVVALAVDPARQPDVRARVRRTEGAAGMGAIGVHENRLD